MRFAHGLYMRFRLFIHEVAKFGVIGAIAFVVTFAGFNLLHFKAGLGTLTANAVATAVATVVAFVGNRYWTFRHRTKSGMRRETILFFALNGIGLLIQEACLAAARYLLGHQDKLTLNGALLVGVVIGTLFRFWSYRKWIWLAVPVPAVVPAAQRAPGAAVNGHELREPETVPPGPGRHRAGRTRI